MIITFKELNEIRKRHQNQKIIFPGGVFDLLHIGHIDYLKEIKKMGDIVVVAITSDERTRERKGENRPIHSEDKRLAMIDAVRYVDYSLIAPIIDKSCSNLSSMLFLMEKLRPEVFVTADPRWVPFKEKINHLGIDLVMTHSTQLDSTSRIIEKIRKINI
ncbi:MAG: adenylyltransferase/cytidyltransferase family protein [Candidatus Paceibacterota bacterium]|jgi:D-beta-D-heptose 7-phosphate kinase/D-beta-D-heptose 1-phosphate adenosyltransferase